MKKFTFIALVLALVLVLAGCCDHEWAEADCVNPQTCEKCQETEGEALGHDWEDADCVTPKTCDVCGETEGDPLGHEWIEADCVTPQTCDVCGETEGEALGHSWLDATTEAPKTCEVCGETEGEKIVTDERFHTAACQDLFGSWSGTCTVDGEAALGMTIDGVDLDYITYVDVEFRNDGSMTISVSFEEESYFHVLRFYTIELMYLTLEQEGIARSQADSVMKDAYGMGVEDYVDTALEAFNIDDYTQITDGVYYVDESGEIYTGDSWNGQMLAEGLILDGDKLYLEGMLDGITIELDRQ